ncbi:MAG: hypothetical protein AB7I96_06055 [Candidatus Dadabacteria bacterium]
MTEYKRTQIGYLMLAFIAIGILLVLNYFYLSDKTNPFLLIILAALAVSLLLFSILTVEVDGEEVSVRFGVGLIRKRFPLSEIESHSAVRNPWYYGWGLRRTPIGWLYNVSGLEAVEITMKDGRKVRIGTDDPAGLDAAIGAALSNKRV